MRGMKCIAAGWLLLALVLPVSARSVAEKKQWARKQFEEAERMREELNRRPAEQRTRHDYQEVVGAYRQVYYTAPTSSRADSAVTAVAELLAESGRQFGDARIAQHAIGQYEFLRREYPGSRYRVQALFAIGEIYRDDLNDRSQALATFREFLKRYPASPMADEARAALKELEHPQSVSHTLSPGSRKPETAGDSLAGSQRPAAGGQPEKPAVAPNSGVLPMVTGIRHWSAPDYTRVAIDLETEVEYQAGRVPKPDRIFFDLRGTKLSAALMGRSFEVQDGLLRKIRVAQYQKDMTRVVLEVDDISDYSAFFLPNPYRLIIDIHGRAGARHATAQAKGAAPSPANAPPASAPAAAPALSARAADGTTSPLKSEAPIKPASAISPGSAPEKSVAEAAHRGTSAPAASHSPDAGSATGKSPSVAQKTSSAPPVAGPAENPGKPAGGQTGQENVSPQSAAATSASVPAAIPASANGKPAPEPVPSPAALKPDSSAGKDNGDAGATDAATLARLNPPDLKTSAPTTGPTFESVSPRATLPRSKRSSASDIHEAQSTADGGRSLTRVLGLKISRIVVDAGHGGHDTGTIGPGGMQEKDLTLDVALRLGKLLETKLGAEVVYTRQDDTFVPLETRTAIANQNQADLFISIHANSSSDASARGVETYYLNFTSSPDALEVAARENAVSQTSIHDLQDLVKKIALKDKIEESREFAADVQKSLWAGLSAKSPAIHNRGVKKAPFIVLIGANMPSILAEISFLSNPTDERRLRQPEYRQRIAEYLYRGLVRYASGLSGVKVAQSRPAAR